MSVTEAPSGHNVGAALRRKEDPPLITGRGRYVDDIKLPGMLWASFVRSPEANAKITSIDTSAAVARDGVTAVYVGEDMADLGGPLPMAWAPPGVEVNNPDHWPLARGAVKHVGDPVAVVIGEDRYAVQDATEDVIVEYESLPAIVDPEAAIAGGPFVHESLGTNKVHEWTLAGGDVEQGFAEADVIVERRVVNHRIAGAPIECRGVIADYRAGSLTLYSATQVPHFVRLFMALLLGLGEDHVRVIAPDVGGGFGQKLQVYGEELLACWASRKLGLPVKWIETRSENMSVAHQGRDQISQVKMGARRDGTITAFHVKILADFGAYNMILTPLIPSLGAFVMGGCYKIPNVQTDITGVFTNKCPTDAIRGAGRPEATQMIEVTLDQVAHELGMDPLEIRRKNFIPKEDFPAEVATGVVYDSGNYHGTLDKLMEHVDVDAFRAEQEQLRTEGIYRGIGFCTWTEICGLAPSRVTGPAGVGVQAGLWESAMVRVHNTGAVTVYTGTSPHGQGLDTAMAQIVADRLGVDPSVVEVIHGDTSMGPEGRNTYGSRSLATGGEAVVKATDKVVAKAKAIVAAELEAAAEDIEVADGKFSVRGSPDKGMALADVAGVAYIGAVPEGMEPGLEETTFYDPENFVFPFGAHACIVDVDAETGKVKVLRYVAVDDCGPAINPMLIDGQIHGGVVHGIGQALYERVHYDDEGQLITGTFVDYALATAAELPMLRDRPHGDALARQLDGRQGRRRGGHDRRLGRRDQRGHRRAAAAWRRLHQHAAQPDAGLGRHTQQRGREPRGRPLVMIPAEFEYTVPETLQDAIKALVDGGEDAKLLAGGHSLLPLMKLRLAAPSLLIDLRKVPGLHGIERQNGHWRIGALTPHRKLEFATELGLVSKVAATIADPAGSPPGDDRRLAGPRRLRVGSAGGDAHHCEAEVTLQGAEWPADGGCRRPVPGLPDDGGRRGRGPDRDPRARPRRLRRRVSEVQPPLGGLGDGRRVCGRQGQRLDLRGRARRPDEHGLDAAAGERRGGGPARAGAEPGEHRQGRRAGRRGHAARRRTSTPPPSTSSTSRGSSPRRAITDALG